MNSIPLPVCAAHEVSISLGERRIECPWCEIRRLRVALADLASLTDGTAREVARAAIRNEPTRTAELQAAGEARSYGDGATCERAIIAAWIRDQPCMRSRDALADAIERGDHYAPQRSTGPTRGEKR